MQRSLRSKSHYSLKISKDPQKMQKKNVYQKRESKSACDYISLEDDIQFMRQKLALSQCVITILQ